MQVHTLLPGEAILLDNGIQITVLSVGADAVLLRITAGEMCEVVALTLPARGLSRRADRGMVGLN
jgi:hypothetical protein